MEQWHDRPANPIISGPSGDALEGRIQRSNQSICRKSKNGILGAIDEASVTLFRLPREFLGLFCLSNIARHGIDQALFGQRYCVPGNPSAFPTFAKEPVLEI